MLTAAALAVSAPAQADQVVPEELIEPQSHVDLHPSRQWSAGGGNFTTTGNADVEYSRWAIPTWARVDTVTIASYYRTGTRPSQSRVAVDFNFDNGGSATTSIPRWFTASGRSCWSSYETVSGVSVSNNFGSSGVACRVTDTFSVPQPIEMRVEGGHRFGSGSWRTAWASDTWDCGLAC